MTRRIAVVMSGFPRHSETFAINELLALDARGMLAGIFAVKAGEDGPPQPGCEALLRRVQYLPPGSAATQGSALATRLHGVRIDGVHGYFAHTPAAVAAHAATALGVPFGFSMHARDARKISRAALVKRARAAACVMACNGDVASELGAAGAAVQMVPHGVNLQRFPFTPPRPAFGRLRLLAVGRLVRKKGFADLVDAVARVGEAVTLKIVGEGPERERLAAQIAAQRLERRVTMPGMLTHADLTHEYAGADVVVVPSVLDESGDRDGLPNVVLEAMASGRPVVGTRVGSLESAIRPGISGLLVPPNAPAALADAIRWCVSAPARRAELGARARLLVQREFDLQPCNARFSELLAAAYA